MLRKQAILSAFVLATPLAFAQPASQAASAPPPSMQEFAGAFIYCALTADIFAELSGKHAEAKAYWKENADLNLKAARLATSEQYVQSQIEPTLKRIGPRRVGTDNHPESQEEIAQRVNREMKDCAALRADFERVNNGSAASAAKP
jgi:hypothetical protein